MWNWSLEKSSFCLFTTGGGYDTIKGDLKRSSSGKEKYHTMEKLQELFSGIFCPEGEGSSNVPSKIVFGGKRKKSLEYSRVTMRPLMLGGKLVYQAEYTYPKKVTHTNLEPSEACRLALALVKEDFKQVNIFTVSEEIQVLA